MEGWSNWKYWLAIAGTRGNPPQQNTLQASPSGEDAPGCIGRAKWECHHREGGCVPQRTCQLAARTCHNVCEATSGNEGLAWPQPRFLTCAH